MRRASKSAHAFGAAIGAILGVLAQSASLAPAGWAPAVGALLGGLAPLVPQLFD